ncbi:ComEA family DNA-binding protein [Marinobacterium stanieri]|uniref:Competence protein ComEA n=1 Tax=Marinobacterium stanieri TaxID=49186 RepID=A0A1N6NF37_9GAMM|nr:ComEA family DNA-binding protein [Marinobacterium stanieri]SIP90700.1 competence protein ComEA [Marinobacterium stanieri]
MLKSLFRAAVLAASFAFAPLSFASEPVDINQASAEQIAAALNGIGPAKAQAIVQYRTTNGPFVSVDQLADVKGIGPATVNKNRSLILVEGSAE